MTVHRLEAEQNLLGTRVRVVVVFEGDVANGRVAVEQCFAECARIEAAFSRFLPDSELSRLNRRLGQWIEVSEELVFLLQTAEALRVATKGAFDVSVGSLLEGWGYDANYSFAEGKMGELGRVEFEGNLVNLSAAVDLGGLGKGYALDRMAAVFLEFSNVLLDAGGDVMVRGCDVDGPFRVAFEHPLEMNQAIGVFESGSEWCALASSASNRRRWGHRQGPRQDGACEVSGWHHLVHPASAAPAEEMLAVYTQASSGLVADAYSTALFVMGFDVALVVLAMLPVEALLVAPDGRVARSSGFDGVLFEVV